MAHEISTRARWGASYKVDSAGWTPGNFAGKRLLDAALTPFKIVGNSADTLFLESETKPQVGNVATFGSPGWTPGQYANTPTLSSVIVDANNVSTVILQSTADSLIIGDVAAPTLPTGWIVQGGRRVVRLGSPTDSHGGYWQIVDPADGSVLDDSDTTTGEVAATEGGVLLPATVGVASSPVDGRGILAWSFVAGFFAAAASSPKGTLHVDVNNMPQSMTASLTNAAGPAPDDPGWAEVKLALDGAAAALGVTIDDTDPHVIVPMLSGSSPLGYARWYRFRWEPDGVSPGTGSLVVVVYGYGGTV